MARLQITHRTFGVTYMQIMHSHAFEICCRAHCRSWNSIPSSRSSIQCLGFPVQGTGFRVQGSGFRVQGSGFR
eukprot:344296-Rhodomonas_salina.3